MTSYRGISDELIEEGRRVGGQRTKRAVVRDALIEYIERRKQAAILELFGTIDFDPEYDYQKQRRTCVLISDRAAHPARRRRAAILELFGTIDFDPEYDYQKQRRTSCPDQ